MADPTPSAVPSLTGNPVLDTDIRSLIMMIGGSASTALITYLANHGINNANLNAQIPVIVVTVLSMAATVATGIWARLAKRTSVNAVVENSITAAATGVVPDAVKTLASPAQKVEIAAAESASPPVVPQV